MSYTEVFDAQSVTAKLAAAQQAQARGLDALTEEVRQARADIIATRTAITALSAALFESRVETKDTISDLLPFLDQILKGQTQTAQVLTEMLPALSGLSSLAGALTAQLQMASVTSVVRDRVAQFPTKR